MNPFKRIISPKSEPLVTVELARACFITGISHQAGDTIRVSERVAQELVAADNAIRRDHNAAAEAERERLAALIPAPVEAKPMPENWQDLPPAFHDLWRLDEAANCLVERRSRIWDVLMATMHRYRALGEGLHHFKATYDHADYGLRAKLQKAFSNLHVGQLPEKHLAEVRHLKDAYHGIEQSVRDWSEQNRDAWTRAKFQAGQHIQTKHGELCRAIRELHALGREIFSCRVAALGLAEIHVDRLFEGSADALKYRSIETPTLGDLKLAWNDDNGPEYYVEKTPAQMVTLLRGWEATSAEVAKLTRQAQAELSKARRVSQAA